MALNQKLISTEHVHTVEPLNLLVPDSWATL